LIHQGRNTFTVSTRHPKEERKRLLHARETLTEMQTEMLTSLLSMVIGLGIGTTMKEGGADLLNQKLHPTGDLRQKSGGAGRFETAERVGKLGELLAILLNPGTKEGVGFGCTL